MYRRDSPRITLLNGEEGVQALVGAQPRSTLWGKVVDFFCGAMLYCSGYRADTPFLPIPY